MPFVRWRQELTLMSGALPLAVGLITPVAHADPAPLTSSPRPILEVRETARDGGIVEEGIDVRVMVETGLYDLECGASANEFLLSYDNIAQARVAIALRHH